MQALKSALQHITEPECILGSWSARSQLVGLHRHSGRGSGVNRLVKSVRLQPRCR